MFKEALCRLLYYVFNVDCSEFMWHDSVLDADLFFIILAESGVFCPDLIQKIYLLHLAWI